jgi:hypothetical protein
MGKSPPIFYLLLCNGKEKKMKKFGFLKPLMAVLLTLAMLLCCACGAKDPEPTNPNALGDGDGKLEAQDFVDGFTTVYGAALGTMGGQTDVSSRTQMDISVNLGDDLISSLGTMMQMYQLPGDASWLKEFGLNMDVNYTKDLTKMVLALRLGGTEAVSAEVIQNMANQMVYMGLPGLNDQYIAVGANVSQSAVAMSGMGDYAALIAALPTEATLNTLLTRYLNLLQQELGDPTVGTETLSFSGISQEVTATTHTIRRSDVLDMAEAVMKAAQTDAELEAMLDKLSAYVNTQGEAEYAEYSKQYGTTFVWETVDLHEELMDEIDSALEDIAETRVELEDGDFLALSVFSDGEKDLGIRLKVVTGYDSVEINAYSLTQNENTALLVEISDLFRLSGTGTRSKDLLSGSYTLSAQGQDMAYLDVKNLDMEALKAGNLKGTLSLRLSQKMIQEMFGYGSFVTTNTRIDINLNTEGDNGVIECKLYDGSKFVLGVTMRTKTLPAEKIQLPTSYVDAQKQEELMNWVSALDLDKLMQNLRQAGVPDELVDTLESSMPIAN